MHERCLAVEPGLATQLVPPSLDPGPHPLRPHVHPAQRAIDKPDAGVCGP